MFLHLRTYECATFARIFEVCPTYAIMREPRRSVGSHPLRQPWKHGEGESIDSVRNPRRREGGKWSNQNVEDLRTLLYRVALSTGWPKWSWKTSC